MTTFHCHMVGRYGRITSFTFLLYICKSTSATTISKNSDTHTHTHTPYHPFCALELWNEMKTLLLSICSSLKRSLTVFIPPHRQPLQSWEWSFWIHHNPTVDRQHHQSDNDKNIFGQWRRRQGGGQVLTNQVNSEQTEEDSSACSSYDNDCAGYRVSRRKTKSRRPTSTVRGKIHHWPIAKNKASSCRNANISRVLPNSYVPTDANARVCKPSFVMCEPDALCQSCYDESSSLHHRAIHEELVEKASPCTLSLVHNSCLPASDIPSS